jgi:hypothetical protein
MRVRSGGYMRRTRFFVSILLALLPLVYAAASGWEAEVYIVRFSGDAGDAWFRYRDLPAAVRCLSPVPFELQSGRLELRIDGDSGILERGRSVLAVRPRTELARVSVLRGAAPGREPRPTRSVSVRFTLDELLSEGGPWSATPAAWACYRAASASGWRSGFVWARSVSYSPRTGRFTVRVGLRR